MINLLPYLTLIIETIPGSWKRLYKIPKDKQIRYGKKFYYTFCNGTFSTYRTEIYLRHQGKKITYLDY